MEFLKKIGAWAEELTKIGISFIAFGVVLEVLFSVQTSLSAARSISSW